MGALAWAKGYTTRGAGDVDNTYTATYSLRKLVREGYLPVDASNNLLLDSGLDDMRWQVTWAESYETFDDELEDRFSEAEGFVVFVHGWTGDYSIWEMLPSIITQANRRLVAIAIDHNGFGGTRFVTDPDVEQCNPPAAMRTLQRWVDLIKIRRQLGDPRLKVVNFVGHSMGGATLFYCDPLQWRYGEYTRYSIAPALLLEDEMKQAFYTSMGIGLSLVRRIPAFEIVYQAVKPRILSILCAGATDTVKETHRVQSDVVGRGTTGATIMAMGVLRDWEIPRNFDLHRILLGHRDPLVGLNPALDLMMKLEFPAAHMRVVPGTHYMFSVGRDYAFQHAQSRELVVEDILQLHNKAYQMQKTGHRIGGSAGLG